MLRRAAFSLGLALSTTFAIAASNDPAPGGAYKTDPAHSSFNWSFNHSGLSSYTARFTKVDARLVGRGRYEAVGTADVERLR